jgi:hypothetical protein
MDDLLAQMMARRNRVVDAMPEATIDPTDDNPPIDAMTENLAYHWRRYERQATAPKQSALKPEASVLRSIKLWCRKLVGIDIKRVSVGRMLSAQGFVMNFGGIKGESDLILTPHAGQPFDRQIHVEVKRPEVMIGGKIAQRAGKQSEDQKAYQERMEARGDKYVVVTSVWDLREYLLELGFQSLPPCKRPKE